MNDHNENNHAAGPDGRQPNGVQGQKLGLPQVEAARPFSMNTATSSFAVNLPGKSSSDFMSEMLKIMLADCMAELEKTREELRQIDPVKEMLSEKERRLSILKDGIFDSMKHISPLLAQECVGKTAADLGGETHEAVTKSSVTVLLMARARAFPFRG